MKKVFISVLSIIILLGVVNISSAFTQTTGFALDDGYWYETYDGGWPGQPGNKLWAESSGYLGDKNDTVVPTWGVYDLYLNRIISRTQFDWGWEYKTLYNGFNVLDPNNPTTDNSNGYYFDQLDIDLKWLLSGLSAIVVADIFDDGSYYGFITLSGSKTLIYDPPFSITAELEEMGPLDNSGAVPGHYGVIKGISVPEPATMLLLGFGLMGIAGIRRKLKG